MFNSNLQLGRSPWRHRWTAHLTAAKEFGTTEVVSRLKKDWAADIDAYDKGHEHMLMFADALTSGIVKQFPKKFN